MHSKEKAVREAAASLHDAVEAALAAGFVVQWPTSAGDLPAMVISETGSVRPEAAEKPSKSKS